MANYDKIAIFYNTPFIQFYYNRVHKKCLLFLKRFIKNNFKILDVACASGIFLSKLRKADQTLDLSGMDESSKMIKLASRKFPKEKFLVGQAEKLPFPNGSLDMVTVLDAFYYFLGKEQFIFECSRTIKEGGYLFLTVPVYDSLLQQSLINLAKAVSKLALFYNTERNSKHWSFTNIKNVVEKSKFKLVRSEISFGQRIAIFQKK